MLPRLTWPAVVLTLPLLALLLATPLAADDVLTLDEAIETALAENLSLTAADARLDAAAADVDMAKSGRLPRVRAEAGVQRTDNPALVFSNKLAQGVFDETDFAIDSLNEPDAFTNWQARLLVEQPIWTGGRLKHGIAAAEAGLGAAEAGREATRQHVVHAVVDAWTGAVVARARVGVAESALKTAEANLRIVSDLREAGLVVASDPLQAEVRVAEVRETVALARADAASAEAALRMALGGWDGELVLPETLPDPSDSETGALDALLHEAESARPALAAAGQARAAAAELSRLERATRLPQIGLQGFAEANDEDFFGTGSSSGGTNYAVGVGLKYDLFDPSRKGRIARAEARRSEAAADVEALRQQVRLDVTRAFHQLDAVRQRLVQTRRAVELADSSLAIVRDRYQNGLAVITELLDSETTLTSARLRRLAAERDLRVAHASLDLAVGRL